MLRVFVFLCTLSLQLFASFTLRPAKADDVDAFYELICGLALYEGKDLETLPCTKEKLIKYGFSKAPRYHVEVAEKGQALVGYALYSFGFSAHQGKPFLYIDDLYVVPEERSQGIGTAFLHRLRDIAREKECCRLEWFAFDWNTRAIEFYERIGGDIRKEFSVIRWEMDP